LGERVYLFTSGRLKRENNTLCLETDEGKRFIPVEGVGELHVYGELTLNKRLLEFLSSHGIILHLFNHYGYYVGSFYPREHYNSGYMILRQAEHYLDPARRLDLASRFVRGALRNMLRVLGYYAGRGRSVEAHAEKVRVAEASVDRAGSVEELMALEGRARETYYEAFNLIIGDPEYHYHGRTRRPPRSRLNALLSFGNTLLYTTVLGQIYRTHLDPRIGFLHATNFRRFTLNLDVAEVFKPILVDRVIFTLANRGMLSPTCFTSELGGVFLSERGKKTFIREYEKKLRTTIHHKALRARVSYRRLIRMELHKLEKHLMGEKPYTPHTAKW